MRLAVQGVPEDSPSGLGRGHVAGVEVLLYFIGCVAEFEPRSVWTFMDIFVKVFFSNIYIISTNDSDLLSD